MKYYTPTIKYLLSQNDKNQNNLNSLDILANDIQDNLEHIYKAIFDLKHLCSQDKDTNIDTVLTEEIIDEISGSLN